MVTTLSTIFSLQFMDFIALVLVLAFIVYLIAMVMIHKLGKSAEQVVEKVVPKNETIEVIEESLGNVEGETNESITSHEKRILQLLKGGSSIEEIELRLLVDPVEMKRIITNLFQKGYPNWNEENSESFKFLKSANVGDIIQQENELTDQEILETLLESKMRPEIKNKIIEKRKNTDKTEKFLSSLKEWKKESEFILERRD